MSPNDLHRPRVRRSRLVRGAVAAAALALVAAGPVAAQVTPPAPAAPWSFGGGDIANTRASYTHPGPAQLNLSNVGTLQVRWTFTAAAGIAMTPTAELGGLYFGDLAGYFYKLNPDTGATIWRHNMSEYSGYVGSYARSSPAVSDTSLIFGDRHTATLFSVNKTTGALNWSTLLDPHPYGAITAAPVIYNGVIYVGVASREEAPAADPTYHPTFRGSAAAVDLATGAILWQFKTVPVGYSGGGSWGSNPAIAPQFGPNGIMFVATGNNYSIPPAATACVAAAGGNITAQFACLDPTDYVDAVLALDMKTGGLIWSRRFQGADTWTVACVTATRAGCPKPTGRDGDFASAPNLVQINGLKGIADDRGGTSNGYLLGAGEKTGIYWGLNPLNGGLFWHTVLGRGEILWGSAAAALDHDRVFVALSNKEQNVNTLAGRNGKPVVWNGGSWAAINALTGQIVWQVPSTGADLVQPTHASAAEGAMTYHNRILFAGDTGGNLVALSSGSGFQHWTFNVGGTVETGPAVFNDMVFWGTGYTHGSPGKTMYAFSLPPTGP